MSIDFEADGPSPSDLAAIEAEWPQIEADLAELDAEIRALYAADHGGPSELDWRRTRRTEAALTRTARRPVASPHTCSPWRLTEIRMSDCRYGCKVMCCDDCGAEQVVHFAAYGCPTGRRAVGLAA